MIKQRSKNTAELNILITKAVLRIQSRLYKSLYKTTKVLEISKDIII